MHPIAKTTRSVLSQINLPQEGICTLRILQISTRKYALTSWYFMCSQSRSTSNWFVTSCIKRQKKTVQKRLLIAAPPNRPVQMVSLAYLWKLKNWRWDATTLAPSCLGESIVGSCGARSLGRCVAFGVFWFSPVHAVSGPVWMSGRWLQNSLLGVLSLLAWVKVSSDRVVCGRDENGAGTDGNKWCHICFHIFMRKQKWIQKHRKQVWKRILRKHTWNEYGVNTDEKRMIIGIKRPPKSCNKTQVSQVNQKTCSPNLSRLLSVIGGIWVGCFDSSIWQCHIFDLLDWPCKTTIKPKFNISRK
jgi:hypothetical protein